MIQISRLIFRLGMMWQKSHSQRLTNVKAIGYLCLGKLSLLMDLIVQDGMCCSGGMSVLLFHPAAHTRLLVSRIEMKLKVSAATWGCMELCRFETVWKSMRARWHITFSKSFSNSVYCMDWLALWGAWHAFFTFWQYSLFVNNNDWQKLSAYINIYQSSWLVQSAVVSLLLAQSERVGLIDSRLYSQHQTSLRHSALQSKVVERCAWKTEGYRDGTLIGILYEISKLDATFLLERSCSNFTGCIEKQGWLGNFQSWDRSNVEWGLC